MSRLFQLAVATVAALALSTTAAPLDSIDSAFEAGPSGAGRIGNWCC